MIVLGGVARFLWLGQPTLWGDEALVFARVYADWDNLVVWLRNDEFTPLHYVATWGLGRVVRLTPEMLRLIPAIFGTLMIPAIYWLGCELRGRRIGLMAAVVVASSAFLITYSRDAKMYAPAWTLCTLHVAALLWWTRCGGLGRWLAWVLLGVLMVGWHASTTAVLAVSLIIAATAPLPTRRGTKTYGRIGRIVAAVLGVAIIVRLLIAYYASFLNMVPEGGPDWVLAHNAGRGLMGRILAVGSTWLIGWEWPNAVDQSRIAPGLLWPLMGMTLALAGILLLALLGRSRSTEVGTTPIVRTRAWLLGWLLLPVIVAGASWGFSGKDLALPRYLGFAMPAVAIAVAMLLRRLDHSLWPGASAVGLSLFVVLNAAVTTLRFSVPTEPPAQRYMADIVTAAETPSTAIVLHARPQPVGQGPVGPGAPATAYPGGFVSAYYGVMEAGLDRGKNRLPAKLMRSPIAANVQFLGPVRVWDDTSPAELAEIAATRARLDHITRLIVWDGHDADGELILPQLRELDEQWSRISSQTFSVREPWTFQSYQPMRRRVYER